MLLLIYALFFQARVIWSVRIAAMSVSVSGKILKHIEDLYRGKNKFMAVEMKYRP